MILNACVKNNKMIDENICKNCKDADCRHAGELTTKERLEKYDKENGGVSQIG